MPMGNLCIFFFYFSCAIRQTLFHRETINIFLGISQNYMYYFTTYGESFQEASENMINVLQICKDHNISLNSEKWFLMMQEGLVLGYYISAKGIEVDPAKMEVIKNIPNPIK